MLSGPQYFKIISRYAVIQKHTKLTQEWSKRITALNKFDTDSKYQFYYPTITFHKQMQAIIKRTLELKPYTLMFFLSLYNVTC